MEETLRALARCPLFSGVGEQTLQQALKGLDARIRRCAKGEALLAAGDPAGCMGVVLRGAVQIVRDDGCGSRSIIARLGPGELFAEAFACAGVETMPVSVLAQEETEALMMEADALVRGGALPCDAHSLLLRNLLSVLAQRSLMCQQKIEIASRRTTREKLMTYLRMQAAQAHSRTFTIPYDRQGLADYLGVDRSGLSAEIGRLRREGVLACERSRFRLLEPLQEP